MKRNTGIVLWLLLLAGVVLFLGQNRKVPEMMLPSSESETAEETNTTEAQKTPVETMQPSPGETTASPVVTKASPETTETLGEWEQREDGNWYFVYRDGSLARGWMEDEDGSWYFFHDGGWMIHDVITPDGYYVGSDGTWIKESDIDRVWMKKESAGNTTVIFDRSSHFLEVWKDGEKVYSCIGTASQNWGDKEIQGDAKTPLGEFYICQKNTQSQYYKSLGLSYPDIGDATRGLENGLISKNEYQAIVQAINRRQTPPWDTALGGAIMIHGDRNLQDWSRGCVSIANQDIDAIWPLVELGDRVLLQE